VGFWREVQARVRRQEIMDLFPYDASRRLLTPA
jgi:isocitrate dehydrogenase kinase/phosphatase